MPSKVFYFRLTIFLFMISDFLIGCARNPSGIVQASQTVVPSTYPTKQANIRPLPLDENALYYYSDGVRIKLTPSLMWISMKFASDDPAQQAAALNGTIANPIGQFRRIPKSEVNLVPLRKGLSTKLLITGVNELRVDTANFILVNPVFQTGDAEMILTDEFIAAFPAGKEKEVINTFNSSHDVEIVEPILGQTNTLILRVNRNARIDALAMANLYQESGMVVYAIPNFIRITPTRN
jgi:hypothetical protein